MYHSLFIYDSIVSCVISHTINNYFITIHSGHSLDKQNLMSNVMPRTKTKVAYC